MESKSPRMGREQKKKEKTNIAITNVKLSIDYNTMNEQISQDTKLDKQQRNSFDWLKAYQWQKGQSGNPAGRPKEKTLKEFARQFLANLTDEERIAYLKSIDPKIVWEMSEGKARQDVEVSGEMVSKIIRLDE